MSQSSNSTSKMNIFSELSTITHDSKINSTTVTRAAKRAASEEFECESKKAMINHHSNEKQASDVAPKSCDQQKFISGAMMVNSVHKDVQLLPELSDDELLAMAIEFEKNNPQ